jgi:brefeldin A-inhibited guanine nucleotide-exchange protein
MPALQPFGFFLCCFVFALCSVLFEEENDEYFVARCLDGFVFAVALSSRLGMAMLRSAFVSSLARFTMLHSPAAMRLKHAQAFR